MDKKQNVSRGASSYFDVAGYQNGVTVHTPLLQPSTSPASSSILKGFSAD